MDPLPKTRATVDDILLELETELEIVNYQCRLGRDLFSVPTKNTGDEATVVRPASASSSNRSPATCSPVGGSFPKQKLTVTTKNRIFEYRDIDDLLGRVVSEEDLKSQLPDFEESAPKPLSKLDIALKQKIPNEMIDGIQLVNSYINDRERYHKLYGDARKNFMEKFNSSINEKLSRISSHDKSVVAELEDLIMTYTKTYKKPEELTLQRPNKLESDRMLVEKMMLSKSQEIQGRINKAVLEDLNSDIPDELLPSVYRTAVMLSNIEKLKSPIVVLDGL